MKTSIKRLIAVRNKNKLKKGKMTHKLNAKKKKEKIIILSPIIWMSNQSLPPFLL